MHAWHHAPDNASMVVRLVLEERDQLYRTARVDHAAQARRSAAYLQLNPAGRIPMLETPQGPIFETATILLWLCDTHRAPISAPDAPDRGPALSWLFLVSNTLHAGLTQVFYPEAHAGADAAAQSAMVAQSRANALRQFDRLAAPYPEQAAPQATNSFIACLLRWAALYGPAPWEGFALDRWPRLRDMALRLEGRPSVAARIAAEGMAGHPFTRPAPPDSTEGSAV